MSETVQTGVIQQQYAEVLCYKYWFCMSRSGRKESRKYETLLVSCLIKSRGEE